MNQKDKHSAIVRWLQPLTDRERKKILHVATTLERIGNIRDSYIFNSIPLEIFLENSFVKKDELVLILITLHSKGVIDIARYYELEVRQVTDDVTVLYDPNSTLEIYPGALKILLEQLNMLINQRDITAQSTKMVWAETYKWENDLEFHFGNGKPVKFSNSDSTRFKIFKLQTEAKGEYLAVKTMAEVTGKSDAAVRIAIGQLNNEKLSNTGFAIVSRNDRGHKGAYRLEQLSSL